MRTDPGEFFSTIISRKYFTVADKSRQFVAIKNPDLFNVRAER